MPVPSFLKSCLASYDLSKLDAEVDKKLIITEVLNKGLDKDLDWLYSTYTKKDISDVLKNPTRGMWLKTVFGYWLKVFEINPPKQKFQEAIIDLDPR